MSVPQVYGGKAADAPIARRPTCRTWIQDKGIMQPNSISEQDASRGRPGGEGDSPVRATLGDRRAEERRVWRMAFLISVALHVLFFLVWPLTGGGPESPFAAAGPRSADDRAAEGVMQAVSLQSAPPAPIAPPPIPTVDVDVPEPVEIQPDAPPDIDVTAPDIPLPGQGTTTGTDPDDTGPAGLPGQTGAGDAGTTEEGRFRLVPPSPRGMIIPPTNRRLRGQEIEVWVFVNETGRVVADSTRLEPPTSDRGFNQQIIREAAQWMFEPARSGGDPVGAWFPYRIIM